MLSPYYQQLRAEKMEKSFKIFRIVSIFKLAQMVSKKVILRTKHSLALNFLSALLVNAYAYVDSEVRPILVLVGSVNPLSKS